MDSLPGTVQTDTITSFCRGVISRHSANWPPEEDALAAELVDSFGAKSFLTKHTLRDLCTSLGITVSFAALPPELRGYNCSFEDKKEIVISLYQTFPGADQHTLLHELREILEATFQRLGHPTLNQQHLVEHAEEFAVLVQIQLALAASFIIFKDAGHIERKLLRYAAYALVGLGGFIYLSSCAFLPYLEDSFQEFSHRRNLRT